MFDIWISLATHRSQASQLILLQLGTLKPDHICISRWQLRASHSCDVPRGAVLRWSVTCCPAEPSRQAALRGVSRFAKSQVKLARRFAARHRESSLLRLDVTTNDFCHLPALRASSASAGSPPPRNSAALALQRALRHRAAASHSASRAGGSQIPFFIAADEQK